MTEGDPEEARLEILDQILETAGRMRDRAARRREIIEELVARGEAHNEEAPATRR